MQLVRSNKIVDDPNWDEVELAIRSLDGESRNEVGLFVNDDCYLQIGGGNEDLYVCAIRINEVLSVLVDPNGPSGKRRIVSGQPDEVPANECFPIDDILVVAKLFFESQERAECYRWMTF